MTSPCITRSPAALVLLAATTLLVISAGACTSDDKAGSSDAGILEGAVSDSPVSGACAKSANGPPITGYQKTNALTVAGASRNYSIYVPASYDGSKAYPVVFVLHGDGGTGDGVRGELTVEPAANDAAIFVYPDGLNQTWDTDDWVDPNKDVPFIDALVSTIQSAYCTDTKRLFVTGISRGAYMSNQLGCWRGGVFRAVASHSGGGPYDTDGKHFDDNGNLICPGLPVPALMIHGDADQVVDISEGEKSLTYWTLADKCQMATTAALPSPCLSQDSCTPSPVTFCKIPGLGHTMWSEAPSAIWSFFDSMK